MRPVPASIQGMKSGLIIACDCDQKRFEQILEATHDQDHVVAYKIGAVLGSLLGLKNAVNIARWFTNKPLIYDHQKGATDTPHIAPLLLDVIVEAGIDSVIFFPQSGPATHRAWVKEALKRYLHTIVGGLMTHDQYLASQNGYILDDAVMDIYHQAISMGLLDVVLPGNKPHAVNKILTSIDMVFQVKPRVYLPGYHIDNPISMLEKNYSFFPIVGRSIYNAQDIALATQKWSIYFSIADT